MGKRYLSDGSANTAFMGSDLSNSEANELKRKVLEGVPVAIKAGKLDLLAEIARISVGRLERITEKLPSNAQILQKIVHALEVIEDPLRIQEWRQQNAPASILRADGAMA